MALAGKYVANEVFLLIDWLNGVTSQQNVPIKSEGRFASKINNEHSNVENHADELPHAEIRVTNFCSQHTS